ncbi:putative ABC transport system permease protein [Streptomyces sp. SLBN-118]|uniref:ABC transporter permease n=1 Tax=Streptomyces sp. SLBN-118 TaxID=2768454 RepID=UPI00115276A8|nr:ABC transporter permease [Streptomyces sp. SLBN-118]TQK53014.1 putative ABC transport system permease protein [Streptomyces sp. SLBN-118]
MNSWYHSWRAAIRIARRDAWRSKGRSFLVLAMIALPILGVSAADLTVRSAELSTEQSLERKLGAADARLSDPGLSGLPLKQTPDGSSYTPVGDFDGKPWPDGKADIGKVLPAGAKSLTDSMGSGKLRTTHGLLNTEIRELKASDPMARGIMVVDQGRLPQKSDEIAATTHFLESSGLTVGSKLTARGFDREYTIVGSYELPDALKTDQVNALPGALLAPLDKALEKAGLPGTEATTSHLVSVSGGFTWNMVKATNAKGVTVNSRAVALDPPARADVPIYQEEGWGSFEDSTAAKAAALAAATTVVGLAMLEICLLAGPAFAVGARRSRRQLGLVGANGGDRRHIRAIVLAGGLVIGFVAAVVGTVLGLLLTFALQPVLEDYLGKRFGSFDVRPLELLGIGLLAVFTGLMAAIVPAITSSRQSVLASLTGRRGVRRSNRVLPVIGLIAVLLGAAVALYGSMMTDQFIVVAGGSAVAELGVVALTPALVGLFGRTGRILPLSPRLALRDAVRNRGRTAPAVAAVLAAVAGTVAVATYTASNDAQGRADYTAHLPHGAVSVMLDEAGGRDVPAVRATVQKLLPIDVRADVDRISVGKSTCSMYSGKEGCGRYEVIVPKANQCPLWMSDPAHPDEDPSEKFSKEQRRKLAQDWRCKDSGGFAYLDSGVVVADAKLLKVLEINDAAAEKALADGQIVSFDKRNLDTKGKINIRLVTDTKKADEAAAKGKDAPGEIKSFTAYQVAGTAKSYGVPMIIPPAAARAAGLSTVPLGAYYSTDKMPSSAQRQRLDGELDKTGSDVELHVEEGYTSENSIILLSLTIFAGLITIGAAGIATGLAQADAEADLKTLAAVGAPPRVRRTLSGFQCGVVAAMGVLLGSAAGVLPAVGLRLTEKREQMKFYREALDQGYRAVDSAPYVPIIVPWETLAALLVVVPVGAALLAALVTRSRGALSRREAT